jgi:hypothetical protein
MKVRDARIDSKTLVTSDGAFAARCSRLTPRKGTAHRFVRLLRNDRLCGRSGPSGLQASTGTPQPNAPSRSSPTNAAVVRPQRKPHPIPGATRLASLPVNTDSSELLILTVDN